MSIEDLFEFSGRWSLPDGRVFFTVKKPSWLERAYRRLMQGWKWETVSEYKRKRK